MQRTIHVSRSTIFIFLLLFCLGSCVYDQELTYLNDQIVALEGRMTTLQETMNGELYTIQDKEAESATKIDQLVRDTIRLSEEVEDNGVVIRGIVERDLSEILFSLEALTQKVADLESGIRRPYEQPGQGVPSAENRAEVGSPIEGEETGTEGPDESISTEQALYNASKDSFDQGRFEESIEGFKRFLERYPKSGLADNAQYWVGECYMALKQYDRAIAAYEEVKKKYPEGNKVPDAMLKQAMAFLEKGDETGARILLKRIVSAFPESDQAKVSEQRLETLK
ncbi:MAG: tol-pal system protein YbgF [Deltaproteobacteria bacterium]|nr:tol-pal system protein YbgF [Deltaproteobacteria bacterium]